MISPTVRNLLLAGCVCVLSAVSPSNGQELPSWKFSADDRANYQLVIETQLNIGPEGNLKQLASVKQQVDYSWEVTEVADDGSATVGVEVHDYQLQVVGPGGKEVEFDTGASHQPQGFAAMLLPLGKQLSESPVHFKMAPTGQVTIIDLPENLSEAVTSVPGGTEYSADGGAASFANLVRLGGWGFPLVSDESGVWQESVPTPPDRRAPCAVTLQYRLLETEESGISRIEKKMLLQAVPDSPVKIVQQQSNGIILFVDALGRPIEAEHSLHAVLESSKLPDQRIELQLTAKYQQIAEGAGE